MQFGRGRCWSNSNYFSFVALFPLTWLFSHLSKDWYPGSVVYYYLLCCLPYNTVHKEVVIGLVGCLFTRLFFFVVCYFYYFTAFLLRGCINTIMCILYHVVVVRGCSSHITLPEEDTIGSILVVILQKRHSLHGPVSSSNGELERIHTVCIYNLYWLIK